MVQKIQAQYISRRDLIDRFGLQFVENLQFFPEWQENLPEITDSEKQQLDQVKSGYINLLNYPPLLENVVRMSVLDPILFIGDFYLSPFHVKAEKSVTIAEEDEGVIVTLKPVNKVLLAEADLKPNQIQDLADAIAGIKNAAGIDLKFRLRIELGSESQPPDEAIAQSNQQTRGYLR